MANLNPKSHWTGAVKTICHTNWLVEKIVVYLLLFSMLLGKGFINVTRATTTQTELERKTKAGFVYCGSNWICLFGCRGVTAIWSSYVDYGLRVAGRGTRAAYARSTGQCSLDISAGRVRHSSSVCLQPGFICGCVYISISI